MGRRRGGCKSALVPRQLQDEEFTTQAERFRCCLTRPEGFAGQPAPTQTGRRQRRCAHGAALRSLAGWKLVLLPRSPRVTPGGRLEDGSFKAERADASSCGAQSKGAASCTSRAESHKSPSLVKSPQLLRGRAGSCAHSHLLRPPPRTLGAAELWPWSQEWSSARPAQIGGYRVVQTQEHVDR